MSDPHITNMFQLAFIQHDSPYNNGRAAYILGMDESCNPYATYVNRLVEAVDWHKGWCYERTEHHELLLREKGN